MSDPTVASGGISDVLLKSYVLPLLVALAGSIAQTIKMWQKGKIKSVFQFVAETFVAFIVGASSWAIVIYGNDAFVGMHPAVITGIAGIFGFWGARSVDIAREMLVNWVKIKA
jgi:hypothetical protein